jgi:hypothetical protein
MPNFKGRCRNRGSWLKGSVKEAVANVLSEKMRAENCGCEMLYSEKLSSRSRLAY